MSNHYNYKQSMKKTVTLGQIEHELANLFPGQKISNIVRFSAVDFTVNNEQMHKEICVLFRFKYSNTEYCWDLDANVIFANVTNLKFNVLDPGEKIVLHGKAYRVYRADNEICVEVKDEPKLKTRADVWKVWKIIEKDYREEFKGHFYPTYVKAMVDGNQGWLVAMKNAGDGYRDILFIRADDAADIRIRHAARLVHYVYLETPSKTMVEYPERNIRTI